MRERLRVRRKERRRSDNNQIGKMKTFHIVNGEVSDGHHTFEELYQHRYLLFLALLHSNQELDSFKVSNHHKGYDLVVTHLYGLQVSYHLPVSLGHYYSHLKEGSHYVWDGHKPTDVIERLELFLWKQTELKSEVKNN